MKLTKNKKSVELTLNTIIIAILVIVVLFVLVFSFTNLFGKQRDQLSDQITGVGDWDNDGTVNMFDKCPCDPHEELKKDGKCTTLKDICKEKIKD